MEARQDFPSATPDADLASLLEALRREREHQGLSLTDLAERTGIDRATISKLETGKVPNPTWFTVRALARALHKRIDWRLDPRGYASNSRVIPSNRSLFY